MPGQFVLVYHTEPRGPQGQVSLVTPGYLGSPVALVNITLKPRSHTWVYIRGTCFKNVVRICQGNCRHEKCVYGTDEKNYFYGGDGTKLEDISSESGTQFYF